MKMGKMRSVGLVAVALAAAMLRDKPAMASIDYGNFSGLNVTYMQVTESSTTTASALYGAPTVLPTANAIEFAASQFGATSSGGGPAAVTEGAVNTTVTADPSIGIKGLTFQEDGDYTLAGSGTAATAVSVTAPITITILQVNGINITPIVSNTTMTYTPGSSFSLPTNAGAGEVYTGSAYVNIDGILAADSVSGTATAVTWNLDNTLTASSEAGSIALISKKVYDSNVMVEPNTTMIPEPISGSLLALGAMGALARRRRA
jgi:hypothetical protein